MYYEAKGLKASGSPPSDNGYQCVTAWWPICRATGTCGASHQWGEGFPFA
nr:MAG TPA: hypothetical protein [Caudoviricetes sp.]